MSVRLRAERPDDAAFRLRLFRETQGAVLAGLEPALVDLLLRQQMAGQGVTYAARYPNARYDIIEHDGVPIGRMVVDLTAEAVTLVDVALVAARRGRGLGTQLLRALIDSAEAAGLPVRLSVLRSNRDALRLYERLGFAVAAADDVSYAMQREPAPVS